MQYLIAGQHPPGLGQWNTIEIYQVSTLEEALTKVNELPTIY